MLPQQTIEELISLAHLQAVAAKAGVTISTPDRDFGIDGSLRPLVKIGRRVFPSGYALDFQLKASTKYQLESNNIVYDLDVKTYNDLIQRQLSGDFIPCILLLKTLPSDQKRWIVASDNHLILGGGCYWHYLSGELSNDDYSVRIRIPQEQLLTSESLTNLLNLVKSGEWK